MQGKKTTGGTWTDEVQVDNQQEPWELIENLPFSMDAGIGGTAKIGVVVLASDYTLDHEFRQIITGPNTQFYQARIENSPQITPQTLADMESRIADTVRLILPGDELNVVAYGCTSASIVMGEKTVFSKIREVHPSAKITTPVTAAFAAFDAFKARRIAVLTPYRRDVNVAVRRYFLEAGYHVPVFGSFNEELDPNVARIDSKSIAAAIEQLVLGRDIDMVFVSCTSVRLLDSVVELEQTIGVPVTSSNHAMAWHCLRLAGVEDAMPQWGRLYSLPACS